MPPLTIGKEFIESYTRAAMDMDIGELVKVWDPKKKEFDEGRIDSKGENSMVVWFENEDITVTISRDRFFLVVSEDEEDNEYIPIVTDVLKSIEAKTAAPAQARAKAAAQATAKAAAQARAKAAAQATAKAAPKAAAKALKKTCEFKKAN